LLTALFLSGDSPTKAGSVRSAGNVLEAAAARARDQGIVVLELGVQQASEARSLASFHAAIALQSVRFGRPAAPTLVLSAGAVPGPQGESEAARFQLALALSLDSHPTIHGLALAPMLPDAAACTGFVLAPDTVARARTAGLDAGAQLLAGRSDDLFTRLGDCINLSGTGSDTVLRAIFLSPD
jgi:hydroxypyruvate reductase